MLTFLFTRNLPNFIGHGTLFICISWETNYEENTQGKCCPRQFSREPLSMPWCYVMYLNYFLTMVLVSKWSAVFVHSVDLQQLPCVGHQVPWPQGTLISAAGKSLRQSPPGLAERGRLSDRDPVSRRGQVLTTGCLVECGKLCSFYSRTEGKPLEYSQQRRDIICLLF